MVKVIITVSEEQVRRRLGKLADPQTVGAVISKAANRSITTGKKVIKQETAKVYNVRQKDVEETVEITKATRAHPTAHMIYKAGHENLFAFGKQNVLSPRYPVMSTDPDDPDPEYVKVKVMNRHIPVALKLRPKPFVQITRNGVLGLFQRVDNRSDAPIRGVAAPAIPQVIKNEEITARFNREISAMFIKRLDYEIGRIWERGGL